MALEKIKITIVWIVQILWGFTKFNFKQILKVWAFYLAKPKSFIPKKYFLSRIAKVDPKDGVSRPNFQWRHYVWHYHRLGCRSYKGSGSRIQIQFWNCIVKLAASAFSVIINVRENFFGFCLTCALRAQCVWLAL